MVTTVDPNPAEIGVGLPGVRPSELTGQWVFNFLMSRAALMGGSSLITDRGRDINKECGYPSNPTVYTYKELYQRGDIAAKVVDLWPDECWRQKPCVYETEDETVTAFEEDWEDIEESLGLLAACQRLDRMSGIGRYGIMFLGFNDGLTDRPAPGYKPVAGVTPDGATTVIDGWAETPPDNTELLYVRVYDESLVSIHSYDGNKASPRYMQPVMYRLKTLDPKDVTGGTPQASQVQDTDLYVHWTRIIHVPADNIQSSEVFGFPRMEQVLNRILDIRKITGGSGEMFWKGGFPGLSFESDPRYQDATPMTPEERDALRSEFTAYSEGLQRYLATVGYNVKPLAPTVADPTAHIDVNIELIAVTLSVPTRVLKGSEEAKLASVQDQKSWNARVSNRNEEHCEPRILRQLVDRLIYTGCVTPPAVRGGAPGKAQESKEIVANAEATGTAVAPPKPKAPPAPASKRKRRLKWSYYIEWPDLNTSTDTEEADVVAKRVQALAAYVAGNVSTLIPPLEFLTKFMGLELEEAVAILESTLEQITSQQNKEPVPGLPAPPTPEEIAMEQAAQQANIDATKAKAQGNNGPVKGPPAAPPGKGKKATK